MKYDAFISYRHSEADQFVAENLHKKLEAFRLPQSIVRQRGKDCKKRIERVFRDRDELPLATNLADPITEALENSEFLIVICSPRLPQSLWCKKEIQTFISMHGREKVLAVLVEGEPDESFPEELLYREREITKEDGTVEIIKEMVEPLAADVRGTTKKEVLKKMDEELLRLTAAMFQCDYDDLKQRHKEQRMKRMLRISLAASAVFLTFGAISTTMAVRIHSQKKQIQTQSEEIVAQKEQIEKQYQETLYNQALSMSEKSLDLLEEGDRLEAMKLASEALGQTSDGTPMPWTAQAQYALTESSYVYQDGTNFEPVHMLKHDANLSVMQVSPNGERLGAVDLYGGASIWNIKNHELLAQFFDSTLYYANEEDIFFLNDNQILYASENGFDIYDIDKKEVVYTYLGEGYLKNGKADTDQGLFAVTMDSIKKETLYIYDAKNYECLISYEVPEGSTVSNAMNFGQNGEYFAFALEPESLEKTNDTTTVILSMDLKTGEISGEFTTKYATVDNLRVIDGILYAGVSQSVDEAFQEGDMSLNVSLKSVVYAIDLKDMTRKWEYRHDDGMFYDFQIHSADFSRHMLVAFYDEVHILNMDTGTLEYEFAYGDKVLTTFYYVNSDRFAVITREGEYHYIDATNGMDIVYEGYFETCSDNLKQILLTENGFVILPYSECNVIYYEIVDAKDKKSLCDTVQRINEVVVNDMENRAVVASAYDGTEGVIVLLMDLISGEIIKEISMDTTFVYTGMVGDGAENFYISTGKSMGIYSVQDGSLQTEYPLSQWWYPESISGSTDGQSVILRSGFSYQKVSLEDGSEDSVEIEDENESIITTDISNDFMMYAVADKEKNAILLYRIDETSPFVTIETVAAFVSKIAFTKDNQYLFVSNMDGSAQVYEVASGKLIQEYSSLGKYFTGIYSLGEAGYFIRLQYDGYMLNQKFELIAHIPECAAILPTTGKYIGIEDESLYICPIYSTEELLKQAEEMLEGV